ncbi:ATP-binding cassette domain-containing protein [Peptostreptococcus equinus]|uniref:ATP-binding cassette domain-containing protein n=1 Tax=Peptostreptococcus equinus TaxID=3003601 RepID=A0ABY7JPD0_9FIRM|nr:ATP-binding cassette domain-containing protein [Peptostreptococcus sp. CBA3647]WAW14341.1 ATP-binding cassette domain-containing protein [Peptostreptococcus sp. CBA3647]
MNIKFNSVSKYYGDKLILDNLKLNIENKSIFFIQGKSGIGKTTIFRLILGLEQADKGEILGIGNRKIGSVFQDDLLIDNISVLANLRLVNKDINRDSIVNYLKDIDVNVDLFTKISQLSGGMKRRISILRSILYDCDTIIMDEPFKGLDRETKEKIMSFVLRNTIDKTLIVISHDNREVDYFKDNSNKKIQVLNLG